MSQTHHSSISLKEERQRFDKLLKTSGEKCLHDNLYDVNSADLLLTGEDCFHHLCALRNINPQVCQE